VIDVLRATTTIVTALTNGASAVYTTADLEEAFKLYGELTSSGVPVLLGGERNGFPVEGFDVGNSPSEYVDEVVTGRTVVFTTSNGTAAIEAMAAAPMLVAAGFVNLGATAEFIRSRGGTTVLCCSGKSGRPSREDIVCAGGLVSRLTVGRPVLDDCSIMAADLYESDKDDLAGVMLNKAEHGRYLVDMGFKADITAATTVDAYSVVVGRQEDGGFVIM
jgi:2-phosphosulfolactate phosphatase